MRDKRTGRRFSTRSGEAGKAYMHAVDCILGSDPGAVDALDQALAADPRFCLALAARYMLAKDRSEEDAEDYRLRALAALDNTEEWERAHVGALFPLLDDPKKNLEATETYLSIFGSDLLVMSQLCSYLIFYGGSSKLEKVKMLLESADSELNTDWAYLARLGFAVGEAGEPDRGLAIVERALEQRTSSLYVIHSYAHVLHEQHSPERSAELLQQWLDRYSSQAKGGALFSHIHWHLVLSEWEQGNEAAAWSRYRKHCAPEVSSCGTVLKLADAAGFLLRAYLREPKAFPVSEGERALTLNFDSMVSHPFIALHIGGILLAIEDLEGLRRIRELIVTDTSAAATVSGRLIDSMIAFLQRHYLASLAQLTPLSAADRVSVGGSYIERMLIDLLQQRAEELAHA